MSFSRVALSDGEKQRICLIAKKAGPTIKQRDLLQLVIKDLGKTIMHTTVSKIIKDSSKWLNMDFSLQRTNVKRHRPAKWPGLEKALIAWFNQVFKEWINKQNRQMRQTNRKILLLMDNASSHQCKGEEKILHGLKCIKLSNILIAFFPANTTSVVQPLDVGIVASVKKCYKTLLLRWYLEQYDLLTDPLMDVGKIQPDVKQAIVWSAQVWQDTSTSTMRNCWRKASILPVAWNANIQVQDERRTAKDTLELTDLDNLISALNLGADALTTEEYVSLARENDIEEELTDAVLVEIAVTYGTFSSS
ncbi:hypothetical protein R1flu_014357 [Riccia fluitans]|uniref:DDE-1 domain-containing protein n=1 Tax=Riccia fluitans TaxID=41844 RepID=A0ABD1YFV9_9MARC